MLAVTLADGGFVGVMWVIFLILGSAYFGIGVISFLMGRVPRRP
jgi:hypothetical protein